MSLIEIGKHLILFVQLPDLFYGGNLTLVGFSLDNVLTLLIVSFRSNADS